MLIKPILAAFSVLLVTSVVLNGLHIKDVISIHTTPAQRADDSAAKLSAADLHPHVDKQLHKMTHDTPLLDSRSLRLRDYKRMQFNGWRNLFDSWREQLSLFIG